MEILPQILVNGFVAGAVLGLTALGFSIIYGTTHIFHFAHGTVYTTTAYTFYSFYVRLHANLWISLLLSICFGILLGILIEVLVYYPLYKKKAHPNSTIISSLGIDIIFINIIALLFGSETKILNSEIKSIYHIGSIVLTSIQIIEIIVAIIIFLLVWLYLKYNHYGKVIRALADNPDLLAVKGVNVKWIRILVFAFGSGLAAIASNLMALDVGIDPYIGFIVMLSAAVATIIGSVGIFYGALIGAFLIRTLQGLVTWQISAKWEYAVTFALLIFFLVFLPRGLFPRKVRVEEM